VALRFCWAVLGAPTGKWLSPALVGLVPVLRRFGELSIDDEIAAALAMMSPATIDRRLAGDRAKMQLRGRSHTKPGSLLKSQIPIRTWTQWDDAVPGFVEIDMVGHEEASRVSGARPFRLIHSEIIRAEFASQQPWDALRDLGRRIGVDELVNLAEIVATAADGAAVFDTLMAEARSMRHADNTAQQTQASVANERLTVPTVCLFICFGALLVYPAAVRLIG